MLRSSLEELFRTFVAHGDEAALDELFRRATPPLRRFAERLGHHGSHADDLVQDTMVSAVELACRFDVQRSFLAWAKGILARKAAHLARDRMRRRTESIDDHAGLSGSIEPPVAEAQEAELRQLLAATIVALPRHYQEPLRMFLLLDKNPQEIAAELDRSRSTVRVQLHRGLQMLRQALPVGAAMAMVMVAQRRLAAAQDLGATPRAGRVPRASGLVCGGALVLALTATGWWWGDGVMSQAGEAVDSQETVRLRDRVARSADQVDAPIRCALEAVVSTPRRGIDVRVWLRKEQPAAAVGLRLEPRSGLDPVLHRRRAVTDASGHAWFAHPGAGAWRIFADRGGSVDLELRAAGGSEVDLKLAAAGRVAGVVLDPAGQVVADAEIWMADAIGQGDVGSQIVRTSPVGRFVLEGVPTGSILTARHHRWGQTAVARVGEHSVGGAQPGVSMTLRFAVAGRCGEVLVRDVRGRPVSGALVHVGRCLDAAPLVLAEEAVPMRPPGHEGRTDAEGVFQTLALAPGRYPIVVRAVGMGPCLRQLWIPPGGGATRKPLAVTCVLKPGAAVAVTVVDGDEEPVVGARVVLRGEGLENCADVRSDREGRAEFRSVNPGSIWLSVRAPGTEDLSREISLQASERRELVFRMRPETGVSGRILTSAGRAAAHFEVRGRGPGTTGRVPRRAFGRADLKGRFQLDLPATPLPALWVRGPGEPLWVAVEAELGVNREERVVRLRTGDEATAWLEGRVLGRRGCGVSGHRLFFRRGEGVAWELGTTDAAGRYRVGPLPPGDYQVFGESTDAAVPSLVLGSQTLTRGATGSLVTRLPSTGTVRWDLAFADGQPPPEIVLTLVASLGTAAAKPRRIVLRHKSRGRQAVLPGRYRLFAMGGDFRWLRGIVVDVRAGEETVVERVLEPATRCQLRLAGLLSDQREGEVVVRRVCDGRWEGAYPLRRGSRGALAAFLSVGDYELELTQSDGSRWRGRFLVAQTTREGADLLVTVVRD